MGGKRRAPPSGGGTQGKAANGDGAAVQGGASRKRQMRGLSLGGGAGSAGAGSCGQEDSDWSLLVPVTMCLAMRCHAGALAGRKAALEAAVDAALRNVVADFGCQEFRVEWTRLGPSKDTLQRVLPLLLERSEPEGTTPSILPQFFRLCKSWELELEARGVCRKTVQLCSALSTSQEFEDFDRLRESAERRAAEDRDELGFERSIWLDTMSFLEKSWRWEGSLHEWLQRASQEPDASFLSGGAASTAEALGLPLVRWVDKPQGQYPESETLAGHAKQVSLVALSPDGMRVVSGSDDNLLRIWDTATGAEVTIPECVSSVLRVKVFVSGCR